MSNYTLVTIDQRFIAETILRTGSEQLLLKASRSFVGLYEQETSWYIPLHGNINKKKPQNAFYLTPFKTNNPHFKRPGLDFQKALYVPVSRVIQIENTMPKEQSDLIFSNTEEIKNRFESYVNQLIELPETAAQYAMSTVPLFPEGIEAIKSRITEKAEEQVLEASQPVRLQSIPNDATIQVAQAVGLDVTLISPLEIARHAHEVGNYYKQLGGSAPAFVAGKALIGFAEKELGVNSNYLQSRFLTHTALSEAELKKIEEKYAQKHSQILQERAAPQIVPKSSGNVDELVRTPERKEVESPKMSDLLQREISFQSVDPTNAYNQSKYIITRDLRLELTDGVEPNSWINDGKVFVRAGLVNSNGQEVISTPFIMNMNRTDNFKAWWEKYHDFLAIKVLNDSLVKILINSKNVPMMTEGWGDFRPEDLLPVPETKAFIENHPQGHYYVVNWNEHGSEKNLTQNFAGQPLTSNLLKILKQADKHIDVSAKWGYDSVKLLEIDDGKIVNVGRIDIGEGSDANEENLEALGKYLFVDPQKFSPSKVGVETMNVLPSQEISSEPFENTRQELQELLANKDTKGLNTFLQDRIKDFTNSENYKKYLAFVSTFHHYSANNINLLLLQNPHVSLIAGAATWKNTYDRFINKGEKALRIWSAPLAYPVKDAKGHPVLDAEGKEKVRLVYKLLPVFDVSQTHGKEIPMITPLEGDVKQYPELFEAIVSSTKAQVSFQSQMSSNARGYFLPSQNQIVLRPGMSEVQTIKTLIHEVTHAALHLNSEGASFGNPVYQRQEFEAESTAFVVCAHYGIDTSDYSFGYLKSWGMDEKSLAELQEVMTHVREEAHDLIKQIDAALEVQLEKNPKENSLDDNIEKAIAHQEELAQAGQVQVEDSKKMTPPLAQS